MTHSLFEKVTMINYELGDGSFASTGFFYEQGENSYLVTNKHVVRHEYGISPDQLRIRIRDKDDPTSIRPVYIDLKDESGDPLWMTHPDYSADVAVIPLEDELEDTGSSAINDEWFVTDADGMSIGSSNEIQLLGGDALVAGYPLAFRERSTHSPVVRHAVIASEYGPEFNGEPCFITDAIMHQGMSGSPVFTSPGAPYWHKEDGNSISWTFSNDDDGDSSHFGGALLGIHSGPIQDRDLQRSDQSDADLQLNQVWYADLIPEIIGAN